MHQTIHHCCLLSKNNSVGLSGSGNKICKGKQQIKIKITLDCHSPRLLPNHSHLSYPLIFPYYQPSSNSMCKIYGIIFPN
jgi:hypothetical protein